MIRIILVVHEFTSCKTGFFANESEWKKYVTKYALLLYKCFSQFQKQNNTSTPQKNNTSNSYQESQTFLFVIIHQHC